MYGVYTADGVEIDRFRREGKAAEVAQYYANRQFPLAYYKKIEGEVKPVKRSKRKRI